jgi:hypothetical protein
LDFNQGVVMNANTATFIVGVLVAVASFLIKELCADAVRGVRFRKRLAQDIKMIIENLKDHYPTLQRLKEAVPRKSPAFIWDSDPGPEGLSENNHYLEPLEASHCIRFYDDLSRMNEIRTEFNLAIRGVITDEETRALHVLIAVACLGDMQKHYRQLISRGCNALLELKRNHWLLSIDEAQCQEDINRQALNEANPPAKVIRD